MRILITRPEPDATATAQILEARGHSVLVEPLLDVRLVEAPDLSFDGVQALVFTSANGVRAFAQQFHCRELPVFGVGAATAAAAGDAGFHVIHESGGDVDLLAADVRKVCTPQAGALLHIAGSVVARDLGPMPQAQGFEVRKAVLYEAKARRGFSPAVAQALKGEDKETSLEAVVLYSPRTARIFKELIDKGGLLSEAQRLSAFCLSENVAKALNGLKLAKIQIADRPRQEDLLKCLDETSR